MVPEAQRLRGHGRRVQPGHVDANGSVAERDPGERPAEVARVAADQRRVLPAVLLDQPAGQALGGREGAAGQASAADPTAPARPRRAAPTTRRSSPGCPGSTATCRPGARRSGTRRRARASPYSSTEESAIRLVAHRSVRSATVSRCWVIELPSVALPPEVGDRRQDADPAGAQVGLGRRRLVLVADPLGQARPASSQKSRRKSLFHAKTSPSSFGRSVIAIASRWGCNRFIQGKGVRSVPSQRTTLPVTSGAPVRGQADQRLECFRGHRVVGVAEAEVLPARVPDPLVARGAETAVLDVDHAHPGVAGRVGVGDRS